MPYRITTSRDSSLFFEVPDPDSDAAPRRVASGTTIPAFDTATNQPIAPLVVGNAGYIDQVVDVPRVDVEADGGRTTIYSAEWIETRGEGSAPVHWSWLSLPTDTALLLPDDLLLTDKGLGARWDGSGWVTVAISGGGTGGQPIDPTPVDPDPDPEDPDPEDPGTPPPATGPVALPLNATFDTAAYWVHNPWRSNVTFSGGAAVVTGDATGHFEVKPVTAGSWVEATAAVASGGSGDATLFVASYNGDPAGAGQYLTEGSVALVAGQAVKVTYQVAAGADRVLVGLKGAGNANIKVTDLTAKTTTSVIVTPVDPPPTDPGTPGTPPPPAGVTSTLTGLIPLAAKNAFSTRVDGAGVPLNPNSAAYVKQFIDSAMTTAVQGINLNAYQYNAVFYVANRNTPRKNIIYAGNPGDAWKAGEWPKWFNNVPVDPAWRPATGTDGHIAIFLPESEGGGRGGTLWEFHVFKGGTAPSAHHGGRILDVSHNMGQFAYPWGVSASGLAFPGMAITLREIRAGRIDHAVYIANKMTRPGNQWPANRDDGWNQAHQWDMIEGMRVRLDPSVNVDSLPMTRAGKIIARAIQQYGLLVADKTAWDHSVCTESGMTEMVTKGLTKDPWDSLLDGKATWDVMDGFPMNRLQVVADAYGKQEVESYIAGGGGAPVVSSTFMATTTTPTPTPTTTPTPTPTPTPTTTPAPTGTLLEETFSTSSAAAWSGATTVGGALDIPAGAVATREGVAIAPDRTVRLTVTSATSSTDGCYYHLSAHDQWGGWIGKIGYENGAAPGQTTYTEGVTPAGTASVRVNIANNTGTVRIAAVKLTA